MSFQVDFCLNRVRELSDLIKNILICVPNMNELTGLERHEGEILMTEFSFLGELPF